MQELTFDTTLALVLAKDPRYQSEAYLFVKEALDYTQKHFVKPSRDEIRHVSGQSHVSGQELLEGIRVFALKEFGPMTTMVFEEWGIRRCEDFGEIVFNMVEIGLLGQTEKDSRADFQNGYDFDEAFRKPFRPENKPGLAADVVKPAGV